MKITVSKSHERRSGYALLFTMIFLTVALIVLGSMLYWVSSNAKVSQRNNQYNMSEAAAEAAVERSLAPMMRDFLSQSLTNASYYASLQITQAGWPVQYIVSDITGARGRISVLPGQLQSVLQPLGSEYANLQGYPWYWTNIAIVTPIGQQFTVPAKVTHIINFSSIPIFQYAIFYNLNLEIDPGADMFVNGPVWSNQGIWAGTSRLTFNSTVSAVSNAVVTANDPFANNKSDSTAPPSFKLAGQPSSHNTPLVMPIAGATNSNPTNVEAILNIPPSTYAMGSANAYTTNGQQYLANASDLIISNSATGINSASPSGTNIFVFYQDQNNSVVIGPVTPDFYILKTPAATGRYTNFVSRSLSDTNRCFTNVYYAGWSFLTNVSFWDYRESDTVQAIQIDVGKFNAWLTNANPNGGNNYNNTCNSHKGHTIDSIWVYNSVNMSSATLPAVRLYDGIQLANSWGLTVATPFPLYLYGDYNKQIDSTHVSSGTNTLYTYPAALMGDAITVLSGSWNDANNNSTALSSRSPSMTVVNAACLEGIVQSVPTISGNYSGGVENFIRYLENWNNTVTNVYNGSIVVMFPSIYATNYWNSTGTTYYQPPKRSWGFDYNFLQQSKLPPLTPQLKKLVRVSWAAN